MVEYKHMILHLSNLLQLLKEKVWIAWVLRQVTYAYRFFPKLWLNLLNYVDPANKKLNL